MNNTQKWAIIGAFCLIAISIFIFVLNSRFTPIVRKNIDESIYGLDKRTGTIVEASKYIGNVK
ncbi:hypothetical protein ACFL38_05015 [Candidatus Omnitrophota bacterium]